jgi:hypothetical protein
MRNSLAAKILSIAMMILTPAAMLMAETGNTMLYASGNVSLNGKEVVHSASVANGDKIETAGATATTVSQNGSKVTLTPYSTIRYQAAGVNVMRGTAAVNTSDGMPAQAAQITVTPKDKTATYEIARVDNNVVITSHTGALMITDAGATTELEAGASSSRPAEPTPAAVPAPAPAPQAAPVFPGSTLTNRDVFFIAAVVAGASVACGLLCGMNAASVPPGGFQSFPKAISAPQARAISPVVSFARAVAVNSVSAGVANTVSAHSNTASRTVQHNSAIVRTAQHRGAHASR